MRFNSTWFIVPICAFLILLQNECSSQQPKIEVVAQTLQSYQAGKTTIKDFIKDADLVNATFPPPYDVGTNPPPEFLLKCIFKTTAGSPWVIYETGLEEGNNFGLGFTRTRKYVVGDTNKPICILAFDKKGILSNISPAPNIAPVPIVKAVPHTSTPPPSLEVVAQTLKTYQIGKTTMEDFIRDADLVKMTNSPFPPTYLNSQPLTSFPTENMYRPRTAGPWRIYKTNVEQNSPKEGVTVTPMRQYEVGDIEKPICILTFDNEGKLTNISPVP